MKICLDARLDSTSGGAQQFVMGLAHGLTRLDDGDEEYYFLTISGEDDWLRPHLGGRSQIISSGLPKRSGWKGVMRNALSPWAGSIRDQLARPRAPQSDGLIEDCGIDLIHFTHQAAFLTDVPSIYQPHDLQHLHHPEFFSRPQLSVRESTYRTHCERARFVVMMSSWGKNDLVRHFKVPEASVHVIPGAPVLPLYGKIDTTGDEEVRRKYALPEDFILYPAQTWPHKNHLTLLEALAILRDQQSLIVPLVCSGRLNFFFPSIENRVQQLRLGAQTTFTGFVDPAEIVSLYRMSRAVVFPSKFEGWGFPLCEAFWSGTPVACSNATCLPAVAGDAALLFDPDDPAGIARAIGDLWKNEQLRARLVDRGLQRAALFSWEKTAKMFRALYRKGLGAAVTEEDLRLLEQGVSV